MVKTIVHNGLAIVTSNWHGILSMKLEKSRYRKRHLQERKLLGRLEQHEHIRRRCVAQPPGTVECREVQRRPLPGAELLHAHLSTTQRTDIKSKSLAVPRRPRERRRKHGWRKDLAGAVSRTMASSMAARWSELAVEPRCVSCTTRSSSCFRPSVAACGRAGSQVVRAANEEGVGVQRSVLR